MKRFEKEKDLDIIGEVERRVGQTIDQHRLIHDKDTVVLGLSGGSDSVALMNVLLKLSKERDFDLVCAHLNHGVRGQDAEADRKYSEDLCQAKGVRCFSTELSEGMGSEDDGRNARYDFYADVVHRIKKERGLLDNPTRDEDVLIDETADIGAIGKMIAAADRPRQPAVLVAVAHNRDDQVETVLHNILRGTGVSGIAGMSYLRIDHRGFDVIRPLMDVSKEEVRAYCDACGLAVCEDRTNEERIYERNVLRLDTLPYLREKHNESVDDALLRLAASARDDEEYFRRTANLIISKGIEDYDDDFVAIGLYHLEYQEPPVLTRIIKAVFAEIGLIIDINRSQIVDAIKIINEGETSKEVHFPQGYRLRIGYKQVFFEAASAQDKASDEEVRIETDILDFDLWQEKYPGGLADLPDNFAAFDADKLGDKIDKLEIRNREAGDFIALGGIGTKKLQDFFVDSKVPKEIRNDVNIVFSGGEALWICGKGFPDRHSPLYQIDDGTKRVLLIETIVKL